FCATLSTPPKLCEDFDQGSFSAQFTNLHVTSDASIGASADAAVSLPNAFLALIPSNIPGSPDAYMSRVFASSVAKTISYSFDVRVDSWTLGSTSGVIAAIILDDSAPTRRTLSFYVTDGYAALEEILPGGDGGYTYKDHALTVHPQLGTWAHVEFDL